MTATTFLTGQEATHPPEPPLVAGPRLSLADGLRLLRTPSSEAGVQAYHRALEGEPAQPQALLVELAALREGRATRFELLAEIASSPTSQARRVSGPGLFLLKVARKVFVASGVAARVRARRAQAAGAQDAALAAAADPSTSVELWRRITMLEGVLIRLENRAFACARRNDEFVVEALEARVSALEAELRHRVVAHPGASRTPDQA